MVVHIGQLMWNMSNHHKPKSNYHRIWMMIKDRSLVGPVLFDLFEPPFKDHVFRSMIAHSCIIKNGHLEFLGAALVRK